MCRPAPPPGAWSSSRVAFDGAIEPTGKQRWRRHLARATGCSGTPGRASVAVAVSAQLFERVRPESEDQPAVDESAGSRRWLAFGLIYDAGAELPRQLTTRVRCEYLTEELQRKRVGPGSGNVEASGDLQQVALDVEAGVDARPVVAHDH